MKNLTGIVFLLSIFAAELQARQFVSLKSSKINMRVGPGDEFPISWVFLRAGLPMMLVAEFQQWRKLRYLDNTEGWIHQNMISGKNNAIVNSDNALLFKRDSESFPIAKVEKGVIVRVLEIRENSWIKVDINKLKGWMKKETLWGVNGES